MWISSECDHWGWEVWCCGGEHAPPPVYDVSLGGMMIVLSKSGQLLGEVARWNAHEVYRYIII